LLHNLPKGGRNIANVNPYQAPAAAVADAGDQTQPVKVFSVSGRIGRARYVAWGFAFYMLFGIIMGVAGALRRLWIDFLSILPIEWLL